MDIDCRHLWLDKSSHISTTPSQGEFLVVDHAPTCFRLNSSSTARNSDSSGKSSNRLAVITTGSSRNDHRLISKIGPIESLPSVDQTEINN